MLKKFDIKVFIICAVIEFVVFFSGIFLAISSYDGGFILKHSDRLETLILTIAILIYWFRDKKFTFGYYILTNIVSNIAVAILNQFFKGIFSRQLSFLLTIFMVSIFIFLYSAIRSFFYQLFKKISYKNYSKKNDKNINTDSIILKTEDINESSNIDEYTDKINKNED